MSSREIESYAGPPAQAEIAEIETLMRTDRAAYFRDEGKQRRYRDLLAARRSSVTLPAATPAVDEPLRQDEGGDLVALPPDVARDVLMESAAGTYLAEEWDRSGGFDLQLGRAQAAAVDLLAALPDIDRLDAIAGFDRLPAGARAAIFAELALGSPSFVRPASPDDVAAFSAISEGRTLLSEWGYRAQRNVAVLLFRMSRMQQAMHPADLAQVRSWFDRLDSTTVMTIFRALVR